MGSLDPAAEEFRPRSHNREASPATFFRPTYSPACFPYACPYAPTGGVQTVALLYGGGAVPVGVVPYPQTQLSSPPAATVSTSPTRSLLLTSVPTEIPVSESMLRRELEIFGDVRGVQMARLREGIVTVHFYDLRHSETAFTAIRWQHLRLSQEEFRAAGVISSQERGLIAGRAVWAQYTLPASDAVPDGQNQGTLVVFNLNSEIDSHSLQEIFETFGPVKELRHTPSKKNQRFVEFFDIRDAAKALKQMNGKEIHGKPVVIKFSRPGGFGRKIFHAPASTVSKPRFAPDYATTTTTITTHFSHFQLSSKNLMDKKVSDEEARTSVNSGEQVCDAVEERHSFSLGRSKRNSPIKKINSETVVESTKRQLPTGRSRNWKGKQEKKRETRFLIKADATVESGSVDFRTTVMIKNIPNKYSQKLLLNMLDNHCIHCNQQLGDGQILSSYDFVYLPIDFNNKCNVGYGFVNMTSPEATLRLYKAFHHQHWEVFNSRKICEVTYARLQGLEALKEHFKNSKFPYETEQYLPVMFSPPRDGKQLTEPLPIPLVGPVRLGSGSNEVVALLPNNRQNGDVEGDDHDDTDTLKGEVDRV